MTTFEPQAALGVMSGTSLDGIDLVRVMTDGEGVCLVEGHFYREYSPELRGALAAAAQGDVLLNDVLRLERLLSEAYAAAILKSGLADGASVVGCHGQTIRHLPREGLTWQLGDMNYIAEKVGVPVVGDFRRRDMAAGGEGAPLVPLFHAMMLGGKDGAVLNVGGVANVTVVKGGTVLASDCGPGVGLVNSWVKEKAGLEFDADGALGLAGQADRGVVEDEILHNGFWDRPVPRSADRYEFMGVMDKLAGMGLEDGAATLAALSAEGIGRTLRELGHAGGEVYLAGGGSRNKAVMAGLKDYDLRAVQELGWHEQHVEAACFAWLAVRRLRGKPASLPTTTGSSRATVGGVVTA